MDDYSDGLIALALLESSAGRKQYANDRLGLFMPLMLEALSEMQGVSFSALEVRNRIRRRFDLELPASVVEALLGRCSKRGYIKREDGRYLRTDKAIPIIDALDEKSEMAKSHGCLINAMSSYARENGIGEFTPKQMRRKLATYLDFHFRNLSIRSIDNASENSNDSENEWISRFLRSAEANHPEYVDTVVKLVRGRIVYDAAFLPGFSGGEQRLRGLTAYLDSPLICRGLGYGSPEEESLVREAVAQLKKTGVRCVVLDCTIREIETVMAWVNSNWGSPNVYASPNSYLYWMPQRGMGKEEAFRCSANASMIIEERLGIETVDTPPRIEKYVSDEKKLSERLKSKDGSVGDRRIWHDIDCVATVLTVRKGEYASTFRKARAFFVSLSPMTIINVGKWWAQDERRTDLSPIFSLVDLANLAWLYDSQGKSASFSKESLMATCAAAMVPSEEVWSAWYTRLHQYENDGRMDAERVRDLLFSYDAKAVLRERGDSLLEDDGDQAFELIIEETVARLAREGYQCEFERHAEAEKQLVSEKEASERVADEAKEALTRYREEHEKKLNEVNAKYEQKTIEQREQVDRVVKVVCRVVCCACLLGVVYSVYCVYANWDNSFSQSDIVQTAWTVLATVVALLTAIDSFRRWIQGKLYEFFRI